MPGAPPYTGVFNIRDHAKKYSSYQVQMYLGSCFGASLSDPASLHRTIVVAKLTPQTSPHTSPPPLPRAPFSKHPARISRPPRHVQIDDLSIPAMPDISSVLLSGASEVSSSSDILTVSSSSSSSPTSVHSATRNLRPTRRSLCMSSSSSSESQYTLPSDLDPSTPTHFTSQADSYTPAPTRRPFRATPKQRPATSIRLPSISSWVHGAPPPPPPLFPPLVLPFRPIDEDEDRHRQSRKPSSPIETQLPPIPILSAAMARRGSSSSFL
ncbi:MAG: hypothetical protein CYPHOPRED_004143 [Cyphobasidiales sp. Tagirdzhanova-0007]|nr:MAG: hypothetical protein CYPHOPRED_004143 [Cyphobasidiales sp. Tagirdzhanova-0007]